MSLGYAEPGLRRTAGMYVDERQRNGHRSARDDFRDAARERINFLRVRISLEQGADRMQCVHDLSGNGSWQLELASSSSVLWCMHGACSGASRPSFTCRPLLTVFSAHGAQGARVLRVPRQALIEHVGSRWFTCRMPWFRVRPQTI